MFMYCSVYSVYRDINGPIVIYQTSEEIVLDIPRIKRIFHIPVSTLKP